MALEKLNQIAENLQTRMPRLRAQLSKCLSEGAPYLKKLNEAYGGDIDNTIAAIADFDPSKSDKGHKGAYTSWIMQIVASGEVNLPEDGPRVKTALAYFDRAKLRGTFASERDIYKYERLLAVEEAVAKYRTARGPVDVSEETQKWRKECIDATVSVVFEDNVHNINFDENGNERDDAIRRASYKLLMIKGNGEKELDVIPASIETESGYCADWTPRDLATEEQIALSETNENAKAVKSTKAAVALSLLAAGQVDGAPIKWCVQHVTTGDSYLDQGPLYLLLRNDNLKVTEAPIYKKYALANHSFDEFRVIDDRRITQPSAAMVQFLKVLLADSKAQETLSEDAKKNLALLLKRPKGPARVISEAALKQVREENLAKAKEAAEKAKQKTAI